MNLLHRLFLFIFLLLLLILFGISPVNIALAASEDNCTIGDAMGNATADGRPVSWKNRDAGGDPVHFVKYLSPASTGGLYGILGLGFGNFDLKMGVNSAGLSLQNSLCDNLGGEYNYDDFKLYLLSNRNSVADVKSAINEVYNGTATYWVHPPGSLGPAICAGFSDAYGMVSLFELNDSTSPYFYEYNPTNANRLTQFPKQIIARENWAHRTTTQLDKLTYTSGDFGRYQAARDSLVSHANAGDLTIKTWVRSVSRIGHPDYDWMPNNNTTQAGMIVHGVNSGEDPQIVTAWVALGNPAYSIYLPAWVAQTTNLSSRVTSGGSTTIGYMSDRIYAKNDLQTTNSETYDQYVDRLFAPVEDNIFEAVDAARTHWFASGFNLNEANRIHTESAETVFATMNSMAAGTGRTLNSPPDLTAINYTTNGTTMTFSVTTGDSDGSMLHTTGILATGVSRQSQLRFIHMLYPEPIWSG